MARDTVASLRSSLQRMRARAENMKEKAEEALGTAIQTVEVGGTSFLFAYLRGRMGDENGDLNVVGIPASLGTGVAMHLVGFLGGFGKYADHAHNIGDGAIAEYAVTMGVRIGADAKVEAGTTQGRRRRPRQLAPGMPVGTPWESPAMAYAR